jgi:hypothetical protein
LYRYTEVADVTEVKAQIKLRFRDVRKQPCVVTRWGCTNSAVESIQLDP